jgi:uncharacterized membrane protein YkvA (DUF1232 family)
MISPKPQDPGFLQGLSQQIKLILRLLADNRVNPLVKALPIASLAYLIWPIDIPGPIDDAVVIGAGLYTFVELCPDDVVAEHRAALEAESKSASTKKKEG